MQNQEVNLPKKWDRTRTILKVRMFDKNQDGWKQQVNSKKLQVFKKTVPYIPERAGRGLDDGIGGGRNLVHEA